MRTRNPLLMSAPVVVNTAVPAGAVILNFDPLSVSMESRDSLAIYGFTGESFTAPACTELVIQDCFFLSSLDLTNCTDVGGVTLSSLSSLATVTCPAALNATGFDCQLSMLDETSVDAICVALAAGTGSNGVLNLANGANYAPSSASAAARTTLTGRGWSLSFNS